MKDYRVEIRVKNNWLWSAITDAGFKSVAEFCRVHDLPYGTLTLYIGLKLTPLTKKDEWRESIKKIADALQKSPGDLFPPEHLNKALERNVAVVEMSLDEMQQLTSERAQLQIEQKTPEDIFAQEEQARLIGEALRHLSPREERAIRLYIGLDGGKRLSLRELGGELGGITPERVREILGKALRKLRHPVRARSLREAADLAGINLSERLLRPLSLSEVGASPEPKGDDL